MESVPQAFIAVKNMDICPAHLGVTDIVGEGVAPVERDTVGVTEAVGVCVALSDVDTVLDGVRLLEPVLLGVTDGVDVLDG
jgi:hypothetical protein